MTLKTPRKWSGCAAVAVGLLMCGTGCASSNPYMVQTEIKQLETREMDLSYNDSYDAILNGLFSLGFPIDHSDKDSGVVTGRRSKPQRLGLIYLGDRNEAVTFKIASISPQLSQLRMKLIVDGNSALDRQLMTKIWQQIEREAMLEGAPGPGEPNPPPTEKPQPRTSSLDGADSMVGMAKPAAAHVPF